MRVIVAILALIGLADIAAAIYLFSGSYDVAASSPENPAVAWVLQQARERSVEAHAEPIAPPALSDPQRVERGAGHYADDCVVCHGAPGVKPQELAAGLNPRPPDLARSTRDDPPAPIFWIVKNGIRMTGMPAWGKSHTDDELWDIVAFVKALPTLKPEDYQRIVRSAGARPENREPGTGAPAAPPPSGDGTPPR